MGIIGSDVRRNIFHQYLGMGASSYDMVGVKGRMDKKFYDADEVKRGVEFMKKNFKNLPNQIQNHKEAIL